MDRRVKERLIGACILVVLVVAVVPEMLSGPKPAAQAGAASAAAAVRLPGGAPDPVRNVTVDLATSKPALADPAAATAAPQPAAEASVANTPNTPAAPSNPTPRDMAGNAPSVDAPVVARTAAPSSPPPAAPPPNTAPPPLAQAFALQLGSFANRKNAEKLVHQLKAQGLSIYMNAEGSGAAARYRVRVGPLADRDAADRMIAKLKGMGHASTLVAPH